MDDMFVHKSTADDLWAVMQTTLNESNHTNRFNIKKIMDFWVTQNQYPILKVTRNYRDGRTVIWTEMRNMSKRHEWWIPVTYTTETNLNFNITPFFQEWITSEQFFINLPSIKVNDWIIVNLQQLGEYSMNLFRFYFCITFKLNIPSFICIFYFLMLKIYNISLYYMYNI